MPDLEIVGVNRPPYGSVKMWQRLTALAAAPRTDLVLKSEVKVNGNSVGLSMHLERPEQKPVGNPPVGDGRLTATNSSPHSEDDPNGSLWYWADQLHLACDSRGTPVIPDETGRRHAGYGGFSYPGNHPEAGRDYHSLSAIYPLQPGCRYTIISAVNLMDLKKLDLPPRLASGVVVAKPVQFSMPEGDFSPTPGGIFIGHDNRETPKPKPSPAPCPEPGNAATTTAPLTFDQRWEQAHRFAGKPFAGLRLEALVGKMAAFKVILRNCSDKEILVKKWKGESDYEVLVRDPTGKSASLTEKGKRFFAGGNLLDIRELKPGDAVEATLPLGSLFLAKTPGEYEVIISLPIVGDVDAVLTAAPVKVQLP